MKNRKFVALLTAVLLGGTAVPMTAPVSAYAATQLAAPTNVILTQDGIAQWASVTSNYGYTVYLFDATNQAVISTQTAPVNSTSFKLEGLTTRNGTYFVKVATRGNGMSTLDSLPSAPSNQLTIASHISMSAPTNLTLTSVGIAQWDNVLNNGYQVNLYHSPSNTLVASKTLGKDSTQLDLSSLVPGSATYYFKVITKGDATMSDSTESNSSNVVNIAVNRLPAPATPTLTDDRLATWTGVTGNNGYRLTVYNADNDSIVGFANANKDTVSYDLSQLITRDGNYYIKVQTLGTGANSSEDSQRSATQTFYLASDLYYVKPRQLNATVDSSTDIQTTTVDVAQEEVLAELDRKATAYNLLTILDADQGRLLLNIPGAVVEKVTARSANATLRLQSTLGSLQLPLADMKDLVKKSNLNLADLTLQVEIGQTLTSRPADLEMIPVQVAARWLDKAHKEVASLADTTNYLNVTVPYRNNSMVDLRTLTGVRLTDKNAYTTIPASFDGTGNQPSAITFHYQGTGTFAVQKKELHFPDVPANHYAKNSIEALASKMVISGFEDGTFRPNDTVTRAQFATMLVKALGLKDKSSVNDMPTFTDVAKSSWYMNNVETAFRSNLISGMGDGRFAPEEKITAQDMSVMVARALRYADPSVPALTDAEQTTLLAKMERHYEISSYAAQAVALCAKMNILTGMTYDSFTPGVPADRAMAADMLYHLLKSLHFSN